MVGKVFDKEWSYGREDVLMENKEIDAVHEIYETFGINFAGHIIRAHATGVTFETVYNHELMGRAKKLCVCSSGPSLMKVM
jgi:hypothetical protein